MFSGSLKTLGRYFQHFPFTPAPVVGFGINLEHGFAVCALEIVGQEIVPAVQAAVALRVGVDDVTAAGEGLNIVGADAQDFGVGEGDVGQRAVCQAVGGAQVGAVIAHGSGLSVGNGVQAAFQSLIPP